MAVTTLSVPRRKDIATQPPLRGYGAQLNTFLFTRAGSFTRLDQAQDLTAAELRSLQAVIDDLRPGHCRIFVQRGLNPDSEKGREAPAFVALTRTLELAQHAGANVNLTWWGQGPYALKERLRALRWPNRNVRTWPQPGLRKWPVELTDPDGPNGMPGPLEKVERFARIIHELRKRFDCITHATIQNEPNGAGSDLAQQGVPHLSMRFYERLYRDFDTALRRLPDPQDPSRSLRQAITIVAGDLLHDGKSRADHQDEWLRYLHANMERRRPGFESVLDAYSIHVYWTPAEFPGKLERRLEGVDRLLASLGSTKPVYVTEYGVRKLVRPASARPGTVAGVNLEHTPEAAFQHAWFNALAPQHRCAGLAKWVMFRTDIVSGWGIWGLIDAPSRRFERTPAYHVTRLFNDLLGPGWVADGLSRNSDRTLLVSRFSAPGRSDESVVVLNGDRVPREVRVAGVARERRFHRARWNVDGKGSVDRPASLQSGARGVLGLTVPGRGLVALSTRREARVRTS